VVADLGQPSEVVRLGSNCYDYVVNLGGYIDHTLFGAGGRKMIRAHFDGLLELLEYLDRSSIRRFVQIGSSDEYGNAPAPQRESLREQPISPYSLGKVAATHFMQMLQRAEGFPAVTLRLFLTYGPGQDERRFLPQIIRGCLDGREFPVSAGEQLRDFCYVDDTVDAIFRSFECDFTNGRILNIASGEPRSIREVIETIVRLIGSGTPKFGAIAYRPGENMALYADTSAAREMLDWSPKVTLEMGIATTIDWMRSCLPSA
jgi:nucleoside-diphosphate-sugar epimerase